MKTEILAYKIHKGTICARDYIAWSHHLLEKNIVSPSVNILASLAPNTNAFEVGYYFQKALQELQLEIPVIEPSSRATIALLANEIVREENEEQLAVLAQEIFHIVVDLQYPKDLIEWYNISEMQDQLTYDTVPLKFTKEDLNIKIKEEAKRVLNTN